MHSALLSLGPVFCARPRFARLVSHSATPRLPRTSRPLPPHPSFRPPLPPPSTPTHPSFRSRPSRRAAAAPAAMPEQKRARTQQQPKNKSKRKSSSSPSPPSSSSSSSRPSRPYAASATIPAGLFNSRTTAIPSQRYTRTRLSRPRFFLFERPESATNRPPGKNTTTTTTPTPTPAARRPVTPMLNYVQVLTTPTADTPGTCLLVHHDSRRYLFGHVAEGTQRVFVQQRLSLARVEEVFLTGPVGWPTAGGLLGLVLTIAEVVSSGRVAAAAEAERKKKTKGGPASSSSSTAAAAAAAALVPGAPKSLSIHGGRNLKHLLATARRFVFRKGLPIVPHEVREDPAVVEEEEGKKENTFRDPDWSDENIMVWYVPVSAEGGAVAAEEPQQQQKKRSHDDMAEETEKETEKETETDAAHDDALLDSVVSHMFDSDWKLDALVETTLHAAKLPAKLFVKGADGKLAEYTGPMPGENANAHDVPDIPVLVRQPWPAALIQALPRTQPARLALCYIVRNHARRGKVDAAAVARMGVAKRDIRLLVAGESVASTTLTNSDGSPKMVTPEMVIGPTVEGAAFAVVDLPDASYVAGFLARPEWTQQAISSINTMFWLLGPGVVHDPRVQAFMQQHADRIRHVVSSTDTCANRLALSSAAALQVQHHRIDPERFPLQQYNNVAPVVAPAVGSGGESSSSSSLPFTAARPGWTIRLAPQVIEEDDKVYPSVDLVQAVQGMDKKVLELADGARAAAAAAASSSSALVSAANRDGLPHPDTEVIPLGTGSAAPSKYRNVSATLVRVPGVGSYLFDCGENTLGSMRRLLGAAQLAAVLRDLRVVWISHLHADHHLGTVSVVRAWHEATRDLPDASPRLAVASHVNMLHWLREYADVEAFGLARVRLVELGAEGYGSGPVHDRAVAPVVFSPDEAREFGLQRIDAVRVEHCHGALAVVMTWTGGDNNNDNPLKIAYSGDCRPSAAFARLGRGATLLLHESTFDDELAGEALAKKHSTMGEALAIGRQMGARRVLLTHFSQRYPKIPVFGEDQGEDANAPGGGGGMQVLVAFDQMRVRLGDFAAAAAYLPALQKLYEGEM